MKMMMKNNMIEDEVKDYKRKKIMATRVLMQYKYSKRYECLRRIVMTRHSRLNKRNAEIH